MAPVKFSLSVAEVEGADEAPLSSAPVTTDAALEALPARVERRIAGLADENMIIVINGMQWLKRQGGKVEVRWGGATCHSFECELGAVAQ